MMAPKLGFEEAEGEEGAEEVDVLCGSFVTVV
jgi:hypothetical protein